MFKNNESDDQIKEKIFNCLKSFAAKCSYCGDEIPYIILENHIFRCIRVYNRLVLGNNFDYIETLNDDEINRIKEDKDRLKEENLRLKDKLKNYKTNYYNLNNNNPNNNNFSNYPIVSEFGNNSTDMYMESFTSCLLNIPIRGQKHCLSPVRGQRMMLKYNNTSIILCKLKHINDSLVIDHIQMALQYNEHYIISSEENTCHSCSSIKKTSISLTAYGPITLGNEHLHFCDYICLQLYAQRTSGKTWKEYHNKICNFGHLDNKRKKKDDKDENTKELKKYKTTTLTPPPLPPAATTVTTTVTTPPSQPIIDNPKQSKRKPRDCTKK